ncbi:hypothetical protein SK128_012291 [Halocaridina rubra]|uniref:Kazal-like domain-containing protein n=1 Tax=Halocaridina rubra TaxID=373956 RepID=A0AAN9A3E2_HALRR
MKTFTLIAFLLFFAYGRGQDECDFGCYDLWDPVCGSDGVTYSNTCELELADCLSEDKITVAYDGECKPKKEQFLPECDPSMIQADCSLYRYAPLCEVSGTSYRSLCDMCQAMFVDQKSKNVVYIIDHLGSCDA